MYRYILFALFNFLLFPVIAQEAINFEPKSLIKKLRKQDCSKKTELVDFPIPISVYKGEDEKGHYYLVKDRECNESASYAFVGRVNTCRSGGCVVHYGDSKAISYEFFDYFIIFNSEGGVELVKVFKYEASHGHEITAKRWLKQFRNYSGEHDLRVGKEIDGITGATTSSITITYDIQERTKRLRGAIEYYKETGAGHKLQGVGFKFQGTGLTRSEIGS